MKIAVMGAGGVGGYFGGKLCAAGSDVTMIARGEHLEAIRTRGLQVRSAAGDFLVRPEATDKPQNVGPVDLVLFCVKSYDTETAAGCMLPMIGPGTTVLTLQNGVDNAEKLARILGAEHVMAGLVYILATVAAPGVVEQTAGPRTLRFGESDGRVTPRTELMLELFHRAGIDASISTDIELDLWRKFLFICAHGGVTALARLTVGEILRSPPTRDLYRGVMEEIATVAKARGVAIPEDAVEGTLDFASAQNPGMRSSLAFDLERGRRLEVEALAGTVVCYGLQAGIPTPFNFAIYASLLPHHLRALAAHGA